MSALESVTVYSNASSYEIFDLLTGVDPLLRAAVSASAARIVGGARQERDRDGFADVAGVQHLAAKAQHAPGW